MRASLRRQSHAACQSYGVVLRSQTPTLIRSGVVLSQKRWKSARTSAEVSNASGKSQPEVAIGPKYAVRGVVQSLLTTRPAPMHVPEAPHPLAWPSRQSMNPSRWDFKYLFSIGKTYLKFYKDGFKNVWNNRKLRTQIRQRIEGANLTSAALYTNTPKISFNEYELALRTDRDIRKLIPFGIVFAICGEFTPLAVLALGSVVVPGTCVIPKQIDKDLLKILHREVIFNKAMAFLIRQHSRSSFDPLLRGPLSPENKERFIKSINILEYYRTGLYPYPQLMKVGLINTVLISRAAYKTSQTAQQAFCAAILVHREGGWATKSPQDMWDWGLKYRLSALLEYACKAHEKGQEIVNDKMKTALLPAYEKETQAIVENANRSHDDIPLFYRGQRGILSDLSPDAASQRAVIENLAKNPPRKPASEGVKRSK